MKKIKVVWVCHLSNSQIRQHLKFNKWSPLAIVKRIAGKESYYDFAQWNTNAIQEFEKFNDIELHVVAPHYGIKGVQQFEMNGINYHFFQSEDDNLLSLLQTRFLHKLKKSYPRNTKTILHFIDQIKPDIIHYIGAENPYYSESALSIPDGVPLMVSLQTLMCDPEFFKNYPISYEEYKYRKNLEVAIIKKVDYVASKIMPFREIIQRTIGDVKFLDMTLAVGETINDSYGIPKQYDFVYFAASISKAIDYALEAFARAKRKHRNITLHVVGGYSNDLMNSISDQMKALGIEDGVDFTGKLPTHDDVINEIRKCRYALLPLKIDLLSGTIRESMANGLPVITTVTPETPIWNEKRQCLLLSEKGDFDAMADNICRLIEDPNLSDVIRSNSFLTIQEKYSNKGFMEGWRKNYFEIVNK